MIRTLVFDFGNVIGFFDHHRATQAIARFTDMPRTALHHLLHESEILDQYERGLMSTAEYIRQVCDRGQIRCSEAEFLTAFTDIFWPNPEVGRLIPRLRPRYRLILASNTCEAHYLSFSGLFRATLECLDGLGMSFRVGARKPETAFYAKVHQLAEADRGECLFIDDKEANVQAGLAFGWQGLVYHPDGSLVKKLQAAGVTIR